jgi:creatinine amidohydrolase
VEGVIERALVRMPADVPVLFLPLLPVGKSNEHIRFPGTLSLTYETLARVWLDIGASVHRAGCRRILFLNSHGGQPQVVDIVCRELRVELGMLAVGAACLRIAEKRDLFSEAELRHGIHGGQVETSVMLHLHPGLIEMELAEDFVALSVEMEKSGSILTPEGTIGFGWQTQDLHPSGALGNAAAADPKRGDEVIQRAATSLLRLIDEIAGYPLSRLADRTSYST